MGKKKRKKKNKKVYKNDNINLENLSVLQIYRYIRKLIMDCEFNKIYENKILMYHLRDLIIQDDYLMPYYRKKLLDCMQKGMHKVTFFNDWCDKRND